VAWGDCKVDGLLAVKRNQQFAESTMTSMGLRRWVYRTNLFQFDDIVASLLDSGRLSWPTQSLGLFNTELLCVFGVQSLPAAELHDVGADDAADGISAEKVIQDVEADVPARSAPRDAF
jgi:hypothetical protein